MKIDPKQEIMGISILKIRNILKSQFPLHYNNVKKQLKLGEEETKELLKEMERLGYLKEIQIADRIAYHITIKGSALSMFVIRKPISRDQANTLLENVLKRVEIVNENPDFLYEISQVYVFGSYLSDVQTLNDLDLAFDIQRKKSIDESEFEVMAEHKIERAKESGKKFQSFFDEKIFPQAEVFQFVKQISKYISLHPLDNFVLKKTTSKLIYTKPE